MRFRTFLLAVALLSACRSATGPTGTAIVGDPDITASVARVEYSAGNTPVGYVAQYNVWLVVPPGSTVGYGAVECPPDSPCYTGTQVVILR